MKWGDYGKLGTVHQSFTMGRFQGETLKEFHVTAAPSGAMRNAWFRSVVAAAGLYTLLGGMVSILGYVLNVPRLTDWEGNGISIQPNAAVCTTLTGLALLALAFGTPYRRWVVMSLGAIVFAVGGASLFQWITGARLELVNEALLFNREWGRLGVVYPGLMGPPGSFCWTLIGLVLVAYGQDQRRGIVPLIPVLTLCLTAISLMGYLYGADTLYAMPRLTVIAFQTATFITAVSIGLIASAPKSGLAKLLGEEGLVGDLVRRTAVAIILVSVGVGYLREVGDRFSIYTSSFGNAARTIVEIVLMLALLWWTTRPMVRHTEEIRRSQEKFSLLFHRSPVGKALTSVPDNRFLEINASFEAITGYARDELLGKTPAEVGLTPDDRNQGAFLSQIDLGSAPSQFEQTLCSKSGETKEVAGSIERTEIDGLPCVFTSIIDVTAQREAERKLKNWNDQLKQQVDQRTADLLESNEQLNGFTYSIAHDLRQHIRGMVINAQIVLRDHAEGISLEGRDTLTRLASAGMRMGSLVDDLLKYARIAKQEPKRQQVDLTEMFREVARELAEHYPAATVRVEDGLGARADMGFVRLAIENLVDNALKYGPTDGPAHIEVGRKNGEFFVRDNGIGFSQDYSRKIFEPFERLVPVDDYPGSGIGLANVKRVIEKHGGSIRAESEPGKGSTFYFTLEPEIRLADDLDSVREKMAAKPS